MAHQSLAPTLESLARLIAFDTRGSESNLPLIQYVRGVLRGSGSEATLGCHWHPGQSIRDDWPRST